MGKTVAKSESLNIQLEIQYPFKKKKIKTGKNNRNNDTSRLSILRIKKGNFQ